MRTCSYPLDSDHVESGKCVYASESVLLARSDTIHYITGEVFGSALIFTHKKKPFGPQKDIQSGIPRIQQDTDTCV